jgi:hypothetical protein
LFIEIISSNNRDKILVMGDHHTVVVHGIAQLALFGYCLLGRGSFTGTVGCFYKVRVRKYHGLPCYKTDQDDPGVNDMALTFFQNSYY